MYWELFRYVFYIFLDFGIDYYIIKIEYYKFIQVSFYIIVYLRQKYYYIITQFKKHSNELEFPIIYIKNCFYIFFSVSIIWRVSIASYTIIMWCTIRISIAKLNTE